jgi:hypothetical protein
VIDTSNILALVVSQAVHVNTSHKFALDSWEAMIENKWQKYYTNSQFSKSDRSWETKITKLAKKGIISSIFG